MFSLQPLRHTSTLPRAVNLEVSICRRLIVLPAEPVSSTVSITVLSVTPARAKKLFAFASVEIDIDGVQIGVHGIRAMRKGRYATPSRPRYQLLDDPVAGGSVRPDYPAGPRWRGY
jgi:hypothetical protein